MENSINKDNLIACQSDIIGAIDQLATDAGFINDHLMPIYDGVYDADAYLNSSPRIMWVLKEPYDSVLNGEATGGGWSIFNLYDQSVLRPSFQVIAYTVYGYLHSLCWPEMGSINENLGIVDVLKQVAVINISKMPSKTVSNNAHIGHLYECWMPVLMKQFLLYDPEVMIFGNTYHHFEKYTIGKRLDPIYEDTDACLKVLEYESKILIAAYHPRQREMTRGRYVNSIINALMSCYARQSKHNEP